MKNSHLGWWVVSGWLLRAAVLSHVCTGTGTALGTVGATPQPHCACSLIKTIPWRSCCCSHQFWCFSSCRQSLSFFLIPVVLCEVRRWSVSWCLWSKWSHATVSLSRAQWNGWFCMSYKIVCNGMRWGIGEEATEKLEHSEFWLRARRIFLQEVAKPWNRFPISFLGDAQNWLGEAPGSLVPLHLVWAGGLAGDPADPCPPHESTVTVQSNLYFCHWLKEHRECWCSTASAVSVCQQQPHNLTELGFFLTENRIP